MIFVTIVRRGQWVNLTFFGLLCHKWQPWGSKMLHFHICWKLACVKDLTNINSGGDDSGELSIMERVI